MKELFLRSQSATSSRYPRWRRARRAKYHRYAIKYGAMFEAGIGAEALYNLCKTLDLKEMLQRPKSAR
jgi:hypothetical protein